MMIPGVKTTGKNSETSLQTNSENFKMSKSNKCLNSQILGLVGFFLQKFTKHHRCGIFSESPGKEYIKNDEGHFKVLQKFIHF